MKKIYEFFCAIPRRAFSNITRDTNSTAPHLRDKPKFFLVWEITCNQVDFLNNLHPTLPDLKFLMRFLRPSPL